MILLQLCMFNRKYSAFKGYLNSFLNAITFISSLIRQNFRISKNMYFKKNENS
jgi:hypothetical protein